MRCRTCYEAIIDEQCHSLDEIIANQKTLAEIVLEIAKIDTKANLAVNLNYLCTICVDKIKDAYEFVLLAQKVNQRLLALNKNDSAILEESPIDIPFVSTWQIKSEVGIGNSLHFIDSVEVDCQLYEPDNQDELNDTSFWQEDTSVKQFGDVKEEPKAIKSNEKSTSLSDIEFSDGPVEEFLRESSKGSSDEEWGKKKEIKKRKRGRPRKSEQPERQILKRAAKGDRENICDVCGKAFIWYKDLIRHAKSHFVKPELKCEYCDRLFLRKDKLNDHLKIHSKHLFNKTRMKGTRLNELNFSKKLYEKQNLKLIQCKLCDREFKRIVELRSHLTIHIDPSTITHIPVSVPAKESDIGDDIIKSRISKELSNGHFAEFYAIVNESGYELCLSDSDETEQEDTDKKEHEEVDFTKNIIMPKSHRYKCMLCEQRCNRQYKMFAHVLESHLNDKLPLECTVCKIKFVCGEMLRQHVRRQCRNKDRKLKCPRCPGKFMWAENSENHHCSNRFNTSDKQKTSTSAKRRKLRNDDFDEDFDETADGVDEFELDEPSSLTAQKLQCDHCDKTFIWPKDLTRHMRLHKPDRERFTCSVCDKKFNRKDNLTVHLKVHNEEKSSNELTKKSTISAKPPKIHSVVGHLTRPHGCKVVECTICGAKQMRMSDLRDHLFKHQNDESYVERWDSLDKVSELLYPELGKTLAKDELVSRISLDLAAKHHQRFYSITDEFGYEVDISSSETDDTDSEPDDGGGGADENESMHDSMKENKLSTKHICEICNSVFDRKYKIFQHQSEKHVWGEAKHICSQCGARFVNEKLLNWHHERQCKNVLKRFVCKKCPVRFMWKQNLDAHIRTTHMEKIEQKTGQELLPLNCPQCNRTFIAKKDLTRHLLMQTCRFEHGEALKCLYCARRFYRTENLSAHMLRHGVTPAELPKAEAILKAHHKPNGAKTILCRICNLSFNNIRALRSHLLKESNSALSQHYTYDSPLNYVITNSLGFEMQIEDSETENEGDIVDDDIEGEQQQRPLYQCVMCNLFAKRKYQIAQHQLSMHKYEELPYKCDRCVFRTVSQDILSQHMRSQCFNTDKKIECDICQFKFMYMENLEKHKQQHHADKAVGASGVGCDAAANAAIESIIKQTFHCDQCPCKYNRKDRLTAHMKKVHSAGGAANKKKNLQTANSGHDVKKEDPKYLCAFCGRYLTSSSNLVIHMRRHTGAEASVSSQADIENHLELGKEFLARGQLTDALTHYHAAVEGDPSNYLTLFKRGTVYLALGKTRFAIQDFSRVLELKPDFTAARLQRGIVYMKTGDYNLASEDFQEVLEDEPNNNAVYEHLGRIEPALEQWHVVQSFADRNEHHNAIKLLTQLLEISPWSITFRKARAESYVAVNDLLAAISDLRSVNKLSPDNTDGLYRLALMLYRIGHASSALKEIRECLKFDPEHKDCFPFYKKLRKVEKNLSAAEQARDEKNYEECINFAETTLKHEKDETMIIYEAKRLLCTCYVRDEQHAKALNPCKEALAIMRDAQILCDRAEAYLGSEMYDDAIHDYQAALEMDDSLQRAKEGIEKAKRLQKQAERRDYYKILGVKRNASKQEIVKAYRKAAQKWHPDNFRDDEKKIAEKKFIDIAAAKEVLTDPEKRRQFDNGEDPLDPEGNQGQGFRGGNPFQHFHHGSPFQFKFHFN